MLDKIGAKAPDQPHAQHFGLKWTTQFLAVRNHRTVSGTELACAINGCRAHEVADGRYLGRIGLNALR